MCSNRQNSPEKQCSVNNCIKSPFSTKEEDGFTIERCQGFLSHLAGLPKAQTVIIFGSMTRWDWYKNSDIDVFIYGDPEGYREGEYWAKLGREIETFICKDKTELQKFPPGLLRNILEGYRVKGKIDFIKVAYA